MEQTFHDLLRERAGEGRGALGCAIWVFAETSMGIVRERVTGVMMRNNTLVQRALLTAFILMMPVLAIQGSRQWAWSAPDIAAVGVLLFGTALIYQIAARNAGGTAYRAAVCMALSTTSLLIWVSLAVGIIGSEDNPANLMYGAVLSTGIIGALIARLRPLGMARALFAMAFAQVVVTVIALTIAQFHAAPAASALRLIGANALFVISFTGSALLFLRADATNPA